MKLLFTLIISLASLALYAQNQYATTSDGKRVLLRSNGTWEYVNKQSTTTRNAVSNTTRTTTPTVQPRKNNSSTSASSGRTYIRGPRGGCYYINRNGNKTYVDRSFCN